MFKERSVGAGRSFVIGMLREGKVRVSIPKMG